MDKERFCTDFHPADCGILEAVGRVLGAGVAGNGGELGARGIRAEVYKLNVRGGFRPLCVVFWLGGHCLESLDQLADKVE